MLLARSTVYAHLYYGTHAKKYNIPQILENTFFTRAYSQNRVANRLSGRNTKLDICGHKKENTNIWMLSKYLMTTYTLHCKDTIPQIRNKYSPRRNCAASVPMSTFMCLWAIYTYIPTIGLAFLLKENMLTDPGNIYINRSQTHEYGNWDWGRAISFSRYT